YRSQAHGICNYECPILEVIMSDPEKAIPRSPDDAKFKQTAFELPADQNVHNLDFVKYLNEDNLSLRYSDDTPVDPIPLTHPHLPTEDLSRVESKRIYIDFAPGDPTNPLNFSRRKKWFITVIVVTMTILVAIPAGAYAVAVPDLVSDFGVSREVATL